MFDGSGESRAASARHQEKVAVRPWERRAQPRFRQRDAARRFNMDTIDARLTTMDRRFGATLVDLSSGGAGLLVTMPVPVDTPVGVELQIGQYTVVAFGEVKNAMKQTRGHRLGVRFIHLEEEDWDLLRLLDGPLQQV